MTKTSFTTAVVAFGVAGLLALPAEAQNRGRNTNQPTARRAVPRARARVARPPVRVAPYRYRSARRYSSRPYYSRPYYYGYSPSALAFSYGYGLGPYGYPAPRYSVAVVGPGYGGVRIDIEPRNAEVYVDGYYVGIVDEFDGVFQKVNLEPAAHRIEIRAPGFETSQFEVNILPGQTITYRTPLQPQP